MRTGKKSILILSWSWPLSRNLMTIANNAIVTPTLPITHSSLRLSGGRGQVKGFQVGFVRAADPCHTGMQLVNPVRHPACHSPSGKAV